MNALLTFPNVTQAIAAENFFLEHKIQLRVMPLPTSLGDFCGIAIQIQRKDVPNAIKLLSKASILFEAIFKIEEKNNEKRYIKWQVS